MVLPMKYENINEVIDDIKRLILEERKDIDLQEIEDFLINKIEENRKTYESSKDIFIKDYLDREREALEKLLDSWKRYVVSLIIKEKNSNIRFSVGSKIEKIAKDINYYFQLDGRKGVFCIVKQKIPPFRGSDKLEYGPFIEGDIIFINKKDCIKLKEKGIIEEVAFNL